MREQMLQRTVTITGSTTQPARDQIAMLLAQDANAPRRCTGLQTDFEHTGQKEFQPVFERAGIPYCLQMVVIALPMALEVVRQVQRACPARASHTAGR